MKKAAERVQQKLSLLTQPEKLDLNPEVSKVEEVSAGQTNSLTILFSFLKWSWMIPYKVEYIQLKSTYRISTNNSKKVSYTL